MCPKCVEHIHSVQIIGVDDKVEMGVDREVVNEPVRGRNNSKSFKVENVFRLAQNCVLESKVQRGYPESHASQACITENSEVGSSRLPLLRI